MGASFLLFGMFSLLSPVVGLVLVAWAVLTIWRAVSLPRNSPREPACENCKYAVASLSTFTCPECGQDLRRVGIVTPRIEATRRGSMAGAILAWTFLCFAGVSIAGSIAMIFVGASAGLAAAGSTTTWQQTLTPNSGAYQSLALTYDSDFQSVTSTIGIELTLADGSTHEIALDSGPMTASGLKSGVVPWDQDTLQAWYGEVGLDTTDPQIAAAAQEAARFVDLLIMSPASTYSTNLSRHTSQMTPVGGLMGGVASGADPFASMLVTILGGLAVAVLVYVLGILWIVRRRRRLLRRLGGTV